MLTKAVLLTRIHHITLPYWTADPIGLITIPRTLASNKEWRTSWRRIINARPRFGRETCTSTHGIHIPTIDIIHTLIAHIHKHIYGQELKGVQVDPRTTLKG
ncbi:hypothetical protein BGZ96_010566 [Linnemannia gamsii]|uniref:Uncharacterized protein n=1 Tax=Linnemannia gamsii TaxID=64522 RepID=A0ABQ7KGP5_9FUNG|nr:hypothetical protein BGZ96_010566 [Linnemannia gamsii]